MKSLRNVITWTFGLIIASVVVIAGSFFLFSILNEYKPAAVEQVAVEDVTSINISSSGIFSLVTWNIGYGGLAKEMDFFYDGGKHVRPDKQYFELTMTGIGDILGKFDSLDFILLQEVDKRANRSYYLDEVDFFKARLPLHCSSFTINYNCRFVPVPVTQPMGSVTSGLATFSRYMPVAVTRNGFDRHFPWPDRLFYMKRCFMVSRYPLPDGHQLVVINIHNSAFDTGGVLRKREMEMIQQFMISEYTSGNFLVAGGDWNANPPGFDPLHIVTNDPVKKDDFTDLQTFFPGWEFVYDPEYPTNRDVGEAYRQGVTPVTIIDFFLVSPNIQVLEVKTFPTGFENSDHQPVYLKIALHPSG